jgi:hypothetical protein
MSIWRTGPRHRAINFNWRRGGGWDLAAEQEAVDNGWQDPFVLFVLQAVVEGRARCGGCSSLFRNTSEVALIAESIPEDVSRANAVAYCLRCVEKHADDLADLDEHAVTH